MRISKLREFISRREVQTSTPRFKRQLLCETWQYGTPQRVGNLQGIGCPHMMKCMQRPRIPRSISVLSASPLPPLDRKINKNRSYRNSNASLRSSHPIGREQRSIPRCQLWERQKYHKQERRSSPKFDMSHLCAFSKCHSSPLNAESSQNAQHNDTANANHKRQWLLSVTSVRNHPLKKEVTDTTYRPLKSRAPPSSRGQYKLDSADSHHRRN